MMIIEMEDSRYTEATICIQSDAMLDDSFMHVYMYVFGRVLCFQMDYSYHH